MGPRQISWMSATPHHAASGAGLDAILRPGVATPALLAPGGNEPSSE
jgi:hypothetical protein